jgi:very-short-patch-repair endonuclease
MAKNSVVLPKAKILRQCSTKAEKLLWQKLRNKQIGKLKFRRQMPLAFGSYHFVADFYCAENKIIIEIDGDIHNEKEVKEYDNLREDLLSEAGYKIIRFRNEEITNSIGGVLNKILKFSKQ